MALSQPLKMHSLSPRSLVTKSGLHIKHGAVNIHSKFESLVCQRWAESCCDTCNVIWVSHQSTSDTLVYFFWTHGLHCKRPIKLLLIPLRQTSRVLAKVLEDIKAITGDLELGLHVHMEPLYFHASLPLLEL